MDLSNNHMNAIEIVNKILDMPSKFYSEGNISIYTLLKNTGYFEMHNQIDELIIFSCLEAQKEKIDQWFDWSENKRVNTGWYLKEESEKFIVGYIKEGGNLNGSTYSDKRKACASFINKEIETIRTNN
jgi:hypothetical protein